METVIADAIGANEARIAEWLAANPRIGTNLRARYSPRLGNLGEGFYRVGGQVLPIPPSMPLEHVRVILKADGHGGFVIQTAYPGEF